MKPHVILLSLASLLIISSCKKAQTGQLELTIHNKTLYNTDDLSVRAGIYLDQDDNTPLMSLGEEDLSNGADASFESGELNNGNYYLKYQLYLSDAPYRSTYNKPFQISAGKNEKVEVEI